MRLRVSRGLELREPRWGGRWGPKCVAAQQLRGGKEAGCLPLQAVGSGREVLWELLGGGELKGTAALTVRAAEVAGSQLSSAPSLFSASHVCVQVRTRGHTVLGAARPPGRRVGRWRPPRSDRHLAGPVPPETRGGGGGTQRATGTGVQHSEVFIAFAGFPTADIVLLHSCFILAF